MVRHSARSQTGKDVLPNRPGFRRPHTRRVRGRHSVRPLSNLGLRRETAAETPQGLRALDESRLEKLRHPPMKRTIDAQHKATVNGAAVKRLPSTLSPFRYPGGKSWLRGHVLDWLATLPVRPKVFIEPFAGGASVGLAVAELCLADEVHLIERDPDV